MPMSYVCPHLCLLVCSSPKGAKVECWTLDCSFSAGAWCSYALNSGRHGPLSRMSTPTRRSSRPRLVPEAGRYRIRARTSFHLCQALVSSMMQVRTDSKVTVKMLTTVSPTQLAQNAEAKSIGRPLAARISVGSWSTKRCKAEKHQA